jgi:hypothetical protein
MAKYMLVANQTIQSAELRDAALDLQANDRAAELTLIVPATRVVHGLMWDEVETKAVAQSRLEAGIEWLKAAGCRIIDGRVGDEDPVLAVEDELRRRRYAGIVISTLPPGVSRWLKLDVVSRIQRRLPPERLVVHVVSNPELADAPKSAR